MLTKLPVLLLRRSYGRGCYALDDSLGMIRERNRLAIAAKAVSLRALMSRIQSGARKADAAPNTPSKGGSQTRAASGTDAESDGGSRDTGVARGSSDSTGGDAGAAGGAAAGAGVGAGAGAGVGTAGGESRSSSSRAAEPVVPIMVPELYLSHTHLYPSATEHVRRCFTHVRAAQS